MRQYIDDSDKLHIKFEASDIAELIKDRYFVSISGIWTIDVKGEAELVVQLTPGVR